MTNEQIKKHFEFDLNVGIFKSRNAPLFKEIPSENDNDEEYWILNGYRKEIIFIEPKYKYRKRLVRLLRHLGYSGKIDDVQKYMENGKWVIERGDRKFKAKDFKDYIFLDNKFPCQVSIYPNTKEFYIRRCRYYHDEPYYLSVPRYIKGYSA